jgi:hypothetical protein
MTPFDDAEQALIDAVQPYTMLSPARIMAFRDAVLYAERYRIPGAIVECGVWRGGAMMAAAKTLLEIGADQRDLYLFDTFEGMNEPADVDRDVAGITAAVLLDDADRDESWIWAMASIDEVRQNVLGTRYPESLIHFVEGLVEETLPSRAPGLIAVLRLDTDWYQSTKHELECLVPRVAPNGVLVIDDYGHWQGCRQAVDEFLRDFDRPVLLARTDYTGRMAIIPPVG